MCSKKRPNNATSNYLISMRAGDLDRHSTNFLGKLRANFVGTEFQVHTDPSLLQTCPTNPNPNPNPPIIIMIVRINFFSFVVRLPLVTMRDCSNILKYYSRNRLKAGTIDSNTCWIRQTYGRALD